MLCNGYGEHNIQGIGDKHIPLIHNVMNTDVVVGVSDRASDSPQPAVRRQCRAQLHGRAAPDRSRRRAQPSTTSAFPGSPTSSPPIKVAKHLDLGADDVIMTVATDSAELYASERRSFLARRYRDGFDEVNAGEIFSRHLEGIVDDHVLELTHVDRKRIFNLGYYTWVEQQGVTIDDFERRQRPAVLARPGGRHPAMGSPDRRVQRGGRRRTRPLGRHGDEQEQGKGGPELPGAARGIVAPRPQPARQGRLPRGSGVVRAGRRLGRDRRQHDVAHADGNDLGADPRRPEGALVLAQHRVERRRSAVRVRR